MKKFLFPLLLLPLLLSGCDLNLQTLVSTSDDLETQSHEQNDDNFHQETEGENDDDDHSQTGGQNEQEQHQQDDDDDDKYPVENEEYRPENLDISLDNWVNYEFHNGHIPDYPTGWNFYYGDSLNPNGALWENPNKKVDYSGIDFKDKNMFLVSPNFESYPRIEVRFEFWFNSHTSDKYKATKNEPTFKVKEFDEKSTLLNADEINFVRSDVPNNNTAYTKTLYIRQQKMSYFILKFNNFIDNGNSSYTPVLTKISLKGWQYE